MVISSFFNGGILGIYTLNPFCANTCPSIIILGCSSAVGEAPGNNMATLSLYFGGVIILTGGFSPFSPL